MKKYDTMRMSVTETLLHDILLELQELNKAIKAEKKEVTEVKEIPKPTNSKLKKG